MVVIWDLVLILYEISFIRIQLELNSPFYWVLLTWPHIHLHTELFSV